MTVIWFLTETPKGFVLPTVAVRKRHITLDGLQFETVTTTTNGITKAAPQGHLLVTLAVQKCQSHSQEHHKFLNWVCHSYAYKRETKIHIYTVLHLLQ